MWWRKNTAIGVGIWNRWWCDCKRRDIAAKSDNNTDINSVRFLHSQKCTMILEKFKYRRVLLNYKYLWNLQSKYCNDSRVVRVENQYLFVLFKNEPHVIWFNTPRMQICVWCVLLFLIGSRSEEAWIQKITSVIRVRAVYFWRESSAWRMYFSSFFLCSESWWPPSKVIHSKLAHHTNNVIILKEVHSNTFRLK